MDDSLQQDDDSEILVEEWKKLIMKYRRTGKIEDVDIDTIKQWVDHPKKGRLIDWKDDDILNGKTILHCVIEYGRLDIAELLLEKGANVHIADALGWTALTYASYFGGCTETMKQLLNKGSNINIANSDGNTALILASDRGHIDSVGLLVEKGADLDIANHRGNTGLMDASYKGHTDAVQLLLDNGADVNLINKYGNTALMKASYQGRTMAVELLLDNGADVTIANRDGSTALSLAQEYGHRKIVELLLAKVASDPNLCNSNGQTVLHLACIHNKKTSARQVLELGTDKDKLDDNNHTALFYAAERGFANIVELLMKHQADVNKTDERRLKEGNQGKSYSFYSVDDGRTPLFVAAQNGHHIVVAILLRYGADPYLCNNESLIPRDVSHVHSSIQQLLRIHDYFDFFDHKVMGYAYNTEYLTCTDDYWWSTQDKAPVTPLEDIIHDIVQYPHFADKFLELYRENREIVNWLDKEGRKVQHMACKECREAILFMGQYYLDDQPVYESPTCTIYNALDYGGREEDLEQPRQVVMKFMEEMEHFENEMGARRKDDGSSRFSSEFVIPHLAAYRADKDPEFAKACSTWKTNVPDSNCIVMPRGERSLLEAMNAENLSAKHKDLQRREILSTLCKIFSYLHEMGYIHGDIKPHNVVRHMDGNVTWKAIDFDACAKVGSVVGLKLTTGSAPPEMLKIIEGEDGDKGSTGKSKIVLLQPGADGLDESELIKADPSFDVWSYGILMYQLVTGGSFFHCDLRGNVGDVGLEDLANLTERRINEKLASVEDVNARVLLSRIFRLNPEERPTMSEIGKDDYFHPSESPQVRKAEFFGKQVCSVVVPQVLDSKLGGTPSAALEPSQIRGAEKDDEDGGDNLEDMERFLSSKAEFSYFKLRDEDKDWSDKLLHSEVETFHFDKLGEMGDKPKFIDGDTIYRNSFLRGLLSSRGPDYFMGFLVEYFGLYKIMNDAHEVCQGIKANLVSDVKSLKGIFIKLFVRGKGLNDVVRGTLFCNSIDQFQYVGRQLKEQYGHNVYIKPPKKEAGAWPIPKLLIYGKKRFHGRCLSVEIQFSTVYMHLATHASNNHLVYEAMRESTGYLIDKDNDFLEFLESLNQQYIDTEGFLRNQSAQEGRFEILVEKVDENESGEIHSQHADRQYSTEASGFVLSGLICCGDRKFQFMSPRDRFQRFSESSFVVNKNLTLLSSHSYWSEESYDLNCKIVEFVVSFKGRGLAIAGIGTAKCLHGATESNRGGARCSVHVGRSKFVIRKSGIEEVFREKKLPDQERAKIIFKMKDGALLVSFVGSEREDGKEIEFQVSMPVDQRYYLYMRAPPGVHDVKFHDITVGECRNMSTEDHAMEKDALPSTASRTLESKPVSDPVPAVEMAEGIEKPIPGATVQYHSSSIPVVEEVSEPESNVHWI